MLDSISPALATTLRDRVAAFRIIRDEQIKERRVTFYVGPRIEMRTADVLKAEDAFIREFANPPYTLVVACDLYQITVECV